MASDPCSTMPKLPLTGTEGGHQMVEPAQSQETIGESSDSADHRVSTKGAADTSATEGPSEMAPLSMPTLEADMTLLSICNATERVCMDLPEDLIERIIAKMPFPAIFKARGLSKSWLARFSPISALHGEPNESLAVGFQKLVSESSNRWPTFCPVSSQILLCTNCSMGFNRISQQWERFPSIPLLPRNYNYHFPVMHMEGPLLIAGWSTSPDAINSAMTNWAGTVIGLQVMVINILTRSWKLLPPHCGRRTKSRIDWIQLVRHTQVDYKVIMVSLDKRCFNANIYDSKSGRWIRCKLSSTTYSFSRKRPFPPVVYCKGVLYIEAGSRDHSSLTTAMFLLAVNVDEGTVTKLWFQFRAFHPRDSFLSDVVAYKDSLMWIVREYKGPAYVFNVNVSSSSLLLVAASSRHHKLGIGSYGPPFLIGNCICFHETMRETERSFLKDLCWEIEGEIVMYNMDKDDWVRWSVPPILVVCSRCDYILYRICNRSQSFAFEPGLTPFIEV